MSNFLRESWLNKEEERIRDIKRYRLLVEHIQIELISMETLPFKTAAKEVIVEHLKKDLDSAIQQLNNFINTND